MQPRSVPASGPTRPRGDHPGIRVVLSGMAEVLQAEGMVRRGAQAACGRSGRSRLTESGDRVALSHAEGRQFDALVACWPPTPDRRGNSADGARPTAYVPSTG
jgi:hypothetical protein